MSSYCFHVVIFHASVFSTVSGETWESIGHLGLEEPGVHPPPKTRIAIARETKDEENRIRFFLKNM